jgi:hypothetical protein
VLLEAHCWAPEPQVDGGVLENEAAVTVPGVDIFPPLLIVAVALGV